MLLFSAGLLGYIASAVNYSFAQSYYDILRPVLLLAWLLCLVRFLFKNSRKGSTNTP